MKTPAAAAAVMLLFLTGWATTTPLPTASGRPEVTVRSRNVAQVRSALVNSFVDRGFFPVQSNGNRLVFQKEDSVGNRLLMGALITGNMAARYTNANVNCSRLIADR